MSDLLASTWDVIPESIQPKLQALGLGPQQPEEPELTDLLKTHTALRQAVRGGQQTDQALCQRLRKTLRPSSKTQVTDLKTISIRKTQLQSKLDQVKSQYAALLQDMQDLQIKLTDGTAETQRVL